MHDVDRVKAAGINTGGLTQTIEDVDKTLSLFNATLESLENRLAPVLTPVNQPNEKGLIDDVTTRDEPMSPVVDTLSNMRDRLVRMQQQTQYMLSRLDL